MIISNSNYWPRVDINVYLYQNGASTEPFIVKLADGATIHMSLDEAQKLHLQLTAAMYEYDTDYKHKEAS